MEDFPYACKHRSQTVSPLTPEGWWESRVNDDQPRMLVITGWPNKDEMERGRMNEGKVKRKLGQMFARAGVPMGQVAFAPLLCWRPDTDREPTEKEVAECRAHLLDYVDDLNPNVILTMGVPALDGCHEPLSIYMRRGEVFKSKVFGKKLVPTFAPGLVLREWDKQKTIEHDLRRAWEQAQTPEFPLGLGDDYFVCITPEEVKGALDYLTDRPIASFDIETEGFNLFEQDEILCVQISSKTGEGFVFPLRGAWARHKKDKYADWQLEHGIWGEGKNEHGQVKRVLFDGESMANHERDKRRKVKVFHPAFPTGSVICQTPDAHNPYSPAYEKQQHICRGTVTNVLRGALEPCTMPGQMLGKEVPHDYNVIAGMLRDWLQGQTKKAAQNGKFDVKGLLYQLGIKVENFVFDTILAYHIIHEEFPHDLDTIRSFVTWMPRYNEYLKTFVPSKKHSFALVPNEVLWTYGAADADCEFRIIEPLMEWLLEDNPADGQWLFDNIAMPLQRTLTQIEGNGILVNRDRLTQLSQWYREKIDSLRTLLSEMAHDDGFTEPEKWHNDNDLREWMFKADYEHEVRKGTLHTCKACHGKDWELCEECVEGKVPGREPEMVACKGINFPTYMAWKSKKTGQPSTGKKSFAALRAWCREEFKYTMRQTGNRRDGTPIMSRFITKTELKPSARAYRARMAEYLDAIEQLKKCIKAKNQFLDGDDEKQVVGAKALLAHIKRDGRVHTTFNQLVETARLSSRDPNMQNQTNSGECGIHQEQGVRCPAGCPGEYRHYSIRSMYTVKEGCKWVAADYRSEEVRIMAYLAGDMKLLEATMTCYGPKKVGGCGLVFLPTEDDPERPLKMLKHERDEGHVAADVHQWVASQVFGVAYDAVTKEQRRQCKSVTFGIAYGQSEMGLADALGWTVERAAALIKLYFQTFPDLAKYQKKCEGGTFHGMDSINGFGRKRHTFGPVEMKPYVREWDWKKVVNAMSRERLNFPTQSTAAEVISLVTIALGDVWGYETGENTVAHRLGKQLCGGVAPALTLRDLAISIILTVHDALEFECPEEHVERLCGIIEDVMVGIPWKILGWFLPVDISVGRYWDDTHDEDEYAAEREAFDVPDDEAEEAA
jgi:uracil-DNA glycosylase family 4